MKFPLKAGLDLCTDQFEAHQHPYMRIDTYYSVGKWIVQTILI